MQLKKLPNSIQRILAARRKLRAKWALSKIDTKQDMKIIDIGCGTDGRSFEDYAPLSWDIVGIDIFEKEKIKHSHPKFEYVKGSAADLSMYDDKIFDLAISIGMLEHITKEKAFNSVVSEIRRVAKQYIVIVPYKYCIVEPHYGVPFFPLLPYNFKLQLVRLLNLSNHREVLKKDPSYINKHYKWRSNSEYRKHFPESTIYIAPTLDTIAITSREELN